jgi:hypothetical protein
MGEAAAFLPRRVVGKEPLQLHTGFCKARSSDPGTDLLVAAGVGTVSCRSFGGYNKKRAGARKSPGPSCGSGESLATAARQGDKTTTSDYQARQSRPCDRTGNGRNRGEQDIPD